MKALDNAGLKQYVEIENLKLAASAYNNKAASIMKPVKLKQYLGMEQDNEPVKIRKRSSRVSFCFHIFLSEKFC